MHISNSEIKQSRHSPRPYLQLDLVQGKVFHCVNGGSHKQLGHPFLHEKRIKYKKIHDNKLKIPKYKESQMVASQTKCLQTKPFILVQGFFFFLGVHKSINLREHVWYPK